MDPPSDHAENRLSFLPCLLGLSMRYLPILETMFALYGNARALYT
jgi:hypothetical protein